MTHITRTELEHIIADPAANYQEPEDVLHDDRLSHTQKVKVLKQWAYDEREIEVAEEENMRVSSEPIVLDRVMLALHQIEKSKK